MFCFKNNEYSLQYHLQLSKLLWHIGENTSNYPIRIHTQFVQVSQKKGKKKVNSDNFIVLPIYIGYIIKYVFLLSNGKNNNTVSKILVISVN